MGRALDHTGFIFPQGHLFGLTLSTAGSSSTFSVAAGEAMDANNAGLIPLASAISKTTASWAVGTGNGSLDTGAIANNTWYHVFLIIRTDTWVIDVLISLSATSPTLPTNFTWARRIGSMKTNGSAQWVLFHQLGDEFLWDIPVTDVNVSNLGTTATLFTLSVPTGIQVNSLIRGFFSNATAQVTCLINSPDESSTAANTPNGNGTIQNPLAGAISGSLFTLNVRTNSSAQIRAVTQVANSTLGVATYGWIDTRGKLF